MRDLSQQQGIGNNPDYLNGNIVDNQTLVGEGINQDIVQFFQKLMDLAELVANGNPDNESNGYQTIDALLKYKFSRFTSLSSKQFELNYVNQQLPASSNITINYPSNITIQTGKFIGLITCTIQGFNQVFDISTISSNRGDLVGGLNLGLSQDFSSGIAYQDRIVLGIGQASIDDFSLVLLVQGTTTT